MRLWGGEIGTCCMARFIPVMGPKACDYELLLGAISNVIPWCFYNMTILCVDVLGYNISSAYILC